MWRFLLNYYPETDKVFNQINGITITTRAPLDPAADYDATTPDGDKTFAAEQDGAFRQNQPGA